MDDKGANTDNISQIYLKGNGKPPSITVTSANPEGEEPAIPPYDFVPIFDLEQFLKIGTGETIIIEGHSYTFSTGAQYKLMNNIDDEYSGMPSTNMADIDNFDGDEKTVRIKDTSKTGVYYSYKNDNNYKMAFIDGIVYSGLILYYDGINNTGNGHSNTTTTWTDLSGSNNNITGVSSANWLGNGLQFNNNVLVSQGGTKTFSKDVTVEIILLNKQRQYVTINFGDVIDLKLRVVGQITYWNAWPTELGQHYSTEEVLNVVTSYSYVNEWTSSNSRKFINNTKSSASVSNLSPTTTKLMIGYSSEVLNGNVYAVRVYNRALSDGEIAQNYAIDQKRFGL